MLNFPNIHLNIAGVVGVGKSSLCNILAKQDFYIFHEPVANNELLAKFYADKQRYSLASQLYFLNKRFEMYQQTDQKNKSIIDRSILEDALFAKMLNISGQLSDIEYKIYQEVFQNYIQHIKKPDLMVYLKIKPENAIQRIKMRGRDYELSQDPQYWYDLNNTYEQYFSTYQLTNLLTIQVDELDFVHNSEHQAKVLHLIASACQVERSHQTIGTIEQSPLASLRQIIDKAGQKC